MNQLGERFNGIEEVKGSSPFRSMETLFDPTLHFVGFCIFER